MEIIHTQHLTDQQKEEIVILWNVEYPAQMAYISKKGFDDYLNKQAKHKHYLLVDSEGEIAGWIMIFTRDNARWFSAIVSTSEQGKGYGTLLLNRAKEEEIELNGWATDHNRYTKNNGETYYSPLGFYEKNGFQILQDVRFESERLSAVKIQWKK